MPLKRNKFPIRFKVEETTNDVYMCVTDFVNALEDSVEKIKDRKSVLEKEIEAKKENADVLAFDVLECSIRILIYKEIINSLKKQ